MLFETRGEQEFLHYATEYFKKSLEQNARSNEMLQQMHDIIANKNKDDVCKYLLIWTDGHTINTDIFTSYGPAYTTMLDKYNSLIPDGGLSEECEAQSFEDVFEAVLYANDYEKYVFKIVKV